MTLSQTTVALPPFYIRLGVGDPSFVTFPFIKKMWAFTLASFIVFLLCRVMRAVYVEFKNVASFVSKLVVKGVLEK